MLSETQMRFLLVLSYFRAAAIMIGVYARSLQGNASSASAHLAADQYVACADIAERLAAGTLAVLGSVPSRL
jgi:hypothetical protein